MAKTRHSGLQKQVLKLYRECLAATAKLSGADAQAQARAHVRLEFRQRAGTVDKLDIQRIEHLMRQGRRKMEIYSAAGVTGVAGFVVQSAPPAMR